MINVQAKVVRNLGVGPGCWHMKLRIPRLKSITPGQFVHILPVPGATVPLLRRPFSIFDYRVKGIKGALLDILFVVVGRGTELLSQRRPGQGVGLLGPLGKGFSIHPARYNILVAGGIGIAPLYLLAKHMVRERHSKVLLLYGAKRKDQLYALTKLKRLGIHVVVSTEDGSMGTKGIVTDLMIRYINRLKVKGAQVYACGPQGMINNVVQIALQKGISCQVSLERMMGCGLGFCGACVTRLRAGDDFRYSRVCTEGPVYPAELVLP
jgi:dihydroorotate dehydrogenase electron transfer subunit